MDKKNELTPEEIQELHKDSEKIETKKKQEEKKFGPSEVAKMIEDALKAEKEKAAGVADSLDEEDPYATKYLTIPRFPTKDGTSKFVVGFKNVNTDEYFKDKIIQAFDVWDDLQKKNVAYVTAIFEDGSEMNLPLFTLIKKSQKVKVEIVDTPKIDKSYSAGKTESVKVDGYTAIAQGTVNMKISKFDYSFIVKLSDGKELAVGKEVINWAIINK